MQINYYTRAESSTLASRVSASPGATQRVVLLLFFSDPLGRANKIFPRHRCDRGVYSRICGGNSGGGESPDNAGDV